MKNTREIEIGDAMHRLFRQGADLAWCGELQSFCLIPKLRNRVQGYVEIKACGRKVTGHNVVWEYFNGPAPRDVKGVRIGDISHLCHNRECCNIEHLTHESRRDNLQRSIVRGTMLKGDRNGQAVLTEEDVRRIRLDPRSSYQVSLDYPTCSGTIRKIRRRERWAHVV